MNGLLLVNLGTPDSYRNRDVYRYLIEFLTDERVIDVPWWRRQLLVRGFIVPSRYRESAKLYRKIWTEQGSPLLVHGRAVQEKLQEALGETFTVALGMRYQNPSIASALDELQKQELTHLIVLPLFPQYASATTGSVHQKVMEHLKQWKVIPKVTFVNSFSTHPGFIDPLCEIGQEYRPDDYDHILFSFHGLPESQVMKESPFCYVNQCYATAQAMADKLKMGKGHYSISFQSRLGKDPWVQPYTTDLLQEFVKQNKKKILVFCPSFVCDCLETTCEIGIEYQHQFRRWGGEHLQLVEGLNSHPSWIHGLKQIIHDHC